MKENAYRSCKEYQRAKSRKSTCGIAQKRKMHKKYTGIREVGFHRTHHEKEEIPYGETAF